MMEFGPRTNRPRWAAVPLEGESRRPTFRNVAVDTAATLVVFALALAAFLGICWLGGVL